MKNAKITATAIVLILGLNMAFAQKHDRDDRDRSDRDRYSQNEKYDTNRRNNKNYENQDYGNNQNGRNQYGDNNNRYYDNYRDNDSRIRDYSNGRNDYRKNPYDYRNFPNNWDRQRSRNFDWYSYDYNNNYDPRFGGFYDNYFPWDPNNPYDIRNNRNYFGNNQYWNGPRPNRIVIVPPMIRLFGGGNWGNNGHHRNGRR